MKTTIYLFCVLLLLSCSNDSKHRTSDTLDYRNDMVEVIVLKDAVSVNGIKWISRNNFQPVAIEAINKQDSILYKKVKNYINAQLKKVNPDKIPEMEGVNRKNPSLLLKQVLEENDCRAYMGLLTGEFEYQDEFDHVSYTLYVAENFNCVEAYFNLFGYYYRNKKVDGKAVYFVLDDASTKNRQLALYCLIKSFQAGYYPSVDVLRDYYKGGRYFPKNDTVHHLLDSIYQSHSEYQMYIKWKEKRESKK